MEVMMRPSENLNTDYYFSAPTSPSHLSEFYKEFDNYFTAESGGGRAVEAAVPFDWEEKPGIPKSLNIGDHDFAFDIVTQDLETASQLSAEELFDGGVIKPLKPPPPPMISETSTSPISQTRKRIQGAFSPRHKNRGTDPFAAAARTTARAAAAPQRGRSVSLSGSSSRRAARSLSPLRDSRYPLEEEESSALSLASAKGQKKWSLKDFFLFRSASEGRAADKDPLKKYTAAAYRRSSFRAVESPGSGSGSSRRRGPVSAHELHYTVNRAVSEDLKKKTFLPYKQGILGRLAFNPAVHALANGFGFSRK